MGKGKFVSFGAMAPPISHQLEFKKPELADKIAHSITLLHIQGIMTDKECEKARRRLIKMYEKNEI